MVHYDREELAVTLFEESGDALFLFDPVSEDMLDVNPMAQRLSGFPYAELLRMKATHLFRSSASGGLQLLRRAFLHTGQFHSQEDFLLRHAKDGVWVPVNLTVTRLRARPKTLGLITARDIGERKKLEASLLHERHLLHSLLDNIPDRIYFKDAQSRFIRVNKAKAARHGLTSPDDFVNKSDFDYFSQEFARRAQADEQRVMETGQPLIAQEESYLDSEGRQHWVSTTKSPLRDDKGQIVGTFGISRDITQHRQLEEQLRQSQKMEAVGQLAGGIAHDFNNLLTVILGYTSLMGEQAQLGQSLTESVRVIRSTAERAAALTRQLLGFSRKQLLMPEVLDLNAVISDLAPMLRRLIGEDIRLHTDLADVLGPIKADRHQLEQVLMNLVVNARDAMPAGGLVIIQTRETEGRVVLTVRDTGQGMSEHTRAHLFEPFFTTKEDGKGTGLGLATVYGIVQQSGGRITVESALGAGAAFRIELPRVLYPAADAAGSPSDALHAAADAAGSPSGERTGSVSCRVGDEGDSGKETILLVEDEEMLRNLARVVLRKSGYTVLEAGHGAEALAICQSYEGTIDLLVTDVVMPVLNGRELADRMALLRPDTKVLYVSGYTTDAVVRNGVFADRVHFLHKPFTPAALVGKVREVLDNKMALPHQPVAPTKASLAGAAGL